MIHHFRWSIAWNEKRIINEPNERFKLEGEKKYTSTKRDSFYHSFVRVMCNTHFHSLMWVIHTQQNDLTGSFDMQFHLSFTESLFPLSLIFYNEISEKIEKNHYIQMLAISFRQQIYCQQSFCFNLWCMQNNNKILS